MRHPKRVVTPASFIKTVFLLVLLPAILKIPRMAKSIRLIFPVPLAQRGIRALRGAGITTLKQLASRTESELALLHGVGDNALLTIKKTLAENGLFLRK